MPDALVCDALLDQNVFAGVGNIIKNEVLFRIRVHPLSKLGALPAHKLRALGGAGAPVQLRFFGMEEGVRAEGALARAHEAQLPSLQRSSDKGISGHATWIDSRARRRLTRR
jgi:hypothetical protein